MIEAKGVVKSFGRKHVLKGIDLTVQDGEVVTIIGGSGTGKSTFIKCVIGLNKVDSGTILIDGEDVTQAKGELALAGIRAKFGYLFQESALFDSLTVSENVSFGLRYLTKIPKEKHRAIAKEKLALVGLKDVEDLSPSELSGGMKKRVALARAIASEPKYILYDEPTTGLDPIMSDIISDLILDLKKQLGMTAIVVTHDMKSAYKISDRIAMMYEGKLLAIDTPEKIKHSKDPHVHQFVEGSSHGPIQMKIKTWD